MGWENNIIGSVLIRFLFRRRNWPDFVWSWISLLMPFIPIARILHYQFIFMHFLLYLFFPFLCDLAIRNAEPSIKHCSLLSTWPYHCILLDFAILSKDSSRPNMPSTPQCFFYPSEMGGVSYFWLRIHSYSDKFNSQLQSDSENFSHIILRLQNFQSLGNQ